MQKKFEIYQTKIKGGCQSGRKVVTHNSKSDLPLVEKNEYTISFQISQFHTYFFSSLLGLMVRDQKYVY